MPRSVSTSLHSCLSLTNKSSFLNPKGIYLRKVILMKNYKKISQNNKSYLFGVIDNQGSS